MGGPVLAELAADRARLTPKSNYELFNCNNFNIRYWSWNYRGCWPFVPIKSVFLCVTFYPGEGPRERASSLLTLPHPVEGGSGLSLKLAPIRL